MSRTLQLAEQLISRPSVTPEDAGCLDLIATRLAPLGFACGGYNDRLSGYQGKGEVMIMRFLKTARGVGVVYQEWLGPAFDPATPASWPVDTALIERRVAQFEAEVALGLVD